MNVFFEQYALALGGFIFHMLKLWLAATNRNEVFINKKLIIWAMMNVLGSALLIYIGRTLPADLIVMSPLTCIIIGSFGSSMLSGFINVKKPKAIQDDNNNP